MAVSEVRPSFENAGASAPRAEDVSLFRRSLPRLRIAFRLASARAAGEDMVNGKIGVNNAGLWIRASCLVLSDTRPHVSTRQSDDRKARENSQRTD
jgi:hypothetical protein